MPMGSKLTHIDESGRARMVDVGAKEQTERRAVAEGFIRMKPETLQLALSGETKKGDVVSVAEIAGVMAAKRTWDLIPMCHPLALTGVKVRVEPVADLPGMRVVAEAKITGRTGVEMEALTAASVACLTLYDMLKAADKAIVIENIKLLEKSGGASGDFKAQA